MTSLKFFTREAVMAVEKEYRENGLRGDRRVLLERRSIATTAEKSFG